MAAPRAGTVSVATLSGLILTVVMTDLVAPLWVQTLGLDVWNFREVQEDARLAKERGVGVDAERVRLLREVEAAGHTVRQYIDAKITLEEAIIELNPVLRNRVGFECAWPQDPPPTFRHAVARYILTRAEAQLRDHPAKFAEVSARHNTAYAALN